jgi:hypothetical protein
VTRIAITPAAFEGTAPANDVILRLAKVLWPVSLAPQILELSGHATR